MSLDDPSLLSAYLDGELDPATRLRVEAELLASPALAEELQAIATAHALVAGLARPTLDVDLSPGVLATIDGRERSRHLQTRVLSLAAAAVLMLACVPLFHNWPANPQPLGRGRSLPGPGIAGNQTTPGAEPTAEGDADPSGRAPSEPVAPPVTSPGAASGLRSLLAAGADGRAPGRIVLVIDDLVPDRVERIARALESNARREPAWAEIGLGSSQVLDAETPGAARVFALRLDPAERDHLREVLARALPGSTARVEEYPTSPALLADLALVAPARSGTAPAVSPVLPPTDPTRLAMKSHPPASEVPPSPPPAAPSAHASPRPYLLWVTSARP